MHTHLPQAPDPQKMPQQKEHLENRKFFGEWWGLMSILNLMDAFLLPPCMLQDISLSARLIGFAGPTEKNSGRARQCIEFVEVKLYGHIISINLIVLVVSSIKCPGF